MKRRYLEAFGVVAPVWKMGEPSNTLMPVLCEVWRSELTISHDPAQKPQVRITAQLEMRVDGKVVGYKGAMESPRPGTVRRYAALGSHHQYLTMTVDRWR